MCQFETSWSNDDLYFESLPDTLIKLTEMEVDGLIEIKSNQIIIKEKGKPFVRNICMAFDLLLQRNQPKTQLFSMTI